MFCVQPQVARFSADRVGLQRYYVATLPTSVYVCVKCNKKRGDEVKRAANIM